MPRFSEIPGSARRHGMRDVAARAGVSLITVSRAIRSPEKVAPETLERIRRAIAELDYLPDLTAGSLASRRSRIIGAIVPTIANSIFAETVQGLSDVLAGGDYQLLLGQSGYDSAGEARLVDAFLSRRVDGLVLTGVRHAPHARGRLQQAAIPIVETWDLTRNPIDMLAGFSNRSAGEAVGRHFSARGYRRLAFVGGDDARSSARARGFAAAAAATGLPAPRVEIRSSPLTMQVGREAIAGLLTTGSPPDAVFFSNDILAAGALLECQQRGWQVPGRVALAGLGDFELASQVDPALTTVRVPLRAIGEEAGRLLLERLAGNAVPRRTIDLGYELIVRASS